MAVYKLGDLLSYSDVRIKSKKITKSTYISTENMLNDAGGVSLANNIPINTSVTKYDIQNILLSNIRPYFRKVWFANNSGGCSNDVLCFIANHKINPKYAFYILSGKKFIDYVVSTSKGTKMPRGDKAAIMEFKVSLPPLSEQEKIIEIIKPIENMILNLENIKNNALRLVDSLPVKSTNKYIEFKSIQTGRHNADFEDSKGHYDFYTCGMKIRKCNNYSFDGKYIILSGNASLYTWWIDGKFDLYQRVYALETNKDFFTSYHSVRNAIRKLRDESSGSVIKYITLNDIKRIELLDNSYESELSKIYKVISSAERILEDLNNIKNSMIHLLIK